MWNKSEILKNVRLIWDFFIKAIKTWDLHLIGVKISKNALHNSLSYLKKIHSTSFSLPHCVRLEKRSQKMMDYKTLCKLLSTLEKGLSLSACLYLSLYCLVNVPKESQQKKRQIWVDKEVIIVWLEKRMHTKTSLSVSL